jgi:hypothetical protein
MTSTRTTAPAPGPRRSRTVKIATVTAAAAIAAAGAGLLMSGGAHAATVTTQTNCAAKPSSCGYPDATNAGVPTGTKLTTVGTGPGQVSSGPGWKLDPRGWVEVSGNGATLTGLYIPFNLDITGNNVTVKNCQIVNSGQTSFGISVRHTTGVTITGNTINGKDATTNRLQVGVKDIYNDSTNLQVLNNNFYNDGVGVQIEAGLIQGNYIHDMGFLPGDHIDGINSDGGVTGQLTINHNTVFDQINQTTAIGLFEDFGVQSNRTVTNNLIAGGSYPIYAGQNKGGPTTTNITITGNRFATIYSPLGGEYGPVAALNAATTTWTGNTWDTTGTTIPRHSSPSERCTRDCRFRS